MLSLARDSPSDQDFKRLIQKFFEFCVQLLVEPDCHTRVSFGDILVSVRNFVDPLCVMLAH